MCKTNSLLNRLTQNTTHRHLHHQLLVVLLQPCAALRDHDLLCLVVRPLHRVKIQLLVLDRLAPLGHQPTLNTPPHAYAEHCANPCTQRRYSGCFLVSLPSAIRRHSTAFSLNTSSLYSSPRFAYTSPISSDRSPHTIT